MARKTKQDALKTREALLNAAEKIFVAKGISRATLTDIASEADLTRGAVYWHFKDKGEILNALCQRASAVVDCTLPATPAPGENAIDALIELTVQTMTLCLQNNHIINLIKILRPTFERNEENRLLFDEVSRFLSKSIGKAEAFFQQAIEQNLLPPAFNCTLAAKAFRAYQHGLFECYLISPAQFPLDNGAELKSFISLFFRGILKVI